MREKESLVYLAQGSAERLNRLIFPADAVVYVHGLWLYGQEAFLLRRRVEAECGCDWHNFNYSSVWQTTAEVTQALAT